MNTFQIYGPNRAIYNHIKKNFLLGAETEPQSQTQMTDTYQLTTKLSSKASSKIHEPPIEVPTSHCLYNIGQPPNCVQTLHLWHALVSGSQSK